MTLPSPARPARPLGCMGGAHPARLCALIPIAVSAFFMAHGMNDLLTIRLGATRPRRSRGLPMPDVAPASWEAEPDARAILARNIFDSSTGPLWPKALAVTWPPFQRDAPEAPTRCDT